MNKSEKSQQGIVLLGVLLVGILVIVGVEVALLSNAKNQVQDVYQNQTTEEVQRVEEWEKISKEQNAEPKEKEEGLLKILPPKERSELESAIKETQKVLKEIQPFNPSDVINTDNMFQSLDEINRQAQEQIQKNIEKQQQEFQQKYQIDINKMMEHFNQNPPAVPQPSPQTQEISPEVQEYYYRKHILKDPVFQW